MRLIRRAWGYYIVFLDRKHFKVKILRFNNGKACSRQFHRLRNELWLILSGSGTMYLDGDITSLRSGDCASVPCDTFHQYTPCKNTTVLEIHYGEKCDEEDIVRV